MGSGNSKHKRAVAFGLALAMLLQAGAAVSACVEDKVFLRGDGLSAQFKVEIADTVQERSMGLMFRRELPRSAGMLFIYPKPQSVAFWMKNTFIPLDLVFLDQRGVVKHVHENAIPQDLTPIPGGRDILAVLEINAGLAAQMGIAPGAQMRHPAFGEQAVWGC